MFNICCSIRSQIWRHCLTVWAGLVATLFFAQPLFSQPISSTSAPNNSIYPDVVKFSYSLSGKSFSNENGSDGKVISALVGGQFHHQINDNLEINADLGVQLESGRTQDFYVDSGTENRIRLNEALLNFKPFRATEFKAGAVNQGLQKTPLLVSSSAFPAFVERLEFFGNSRHKVSLQMQQAIPTSESYSTEVVESEPTPYYMLETVNYKFLSDSKKWETDFYLHYFSFYRLPSAVAIKGELFGNQVVRPTIETADFLYPFQGAYFKLDQRFEFLENWGLSGSVDYLRNYKSPKETGSAHALRLGLDYSRSDDKYFVAAEIFSIGPNAAPAFYGNTLYGYTNRQGFGLDLGVEQVRQDTKMGLKIYDSNLLYENLKQAHQRVIMLYIGVNYG